MKKKKKQKPEYKETNGIPICPYCQKPTKRIYKSSTSTLAYYPLCYGGRGINANFDKNLIIFNWHCEECKRDYEIRGNLIDGFDYYNLELGKLNEK